MKYKLRTLLLCLPLLAAAFGGLPMRPEEIEDLMHTMNQQKIAYIIPADERNGDDPPQ